MTTEEGKIIINDYREKCSILKQIQSNKKDFYDACKNWFMLTTLASSLLLTAVVFINKNLLSDMVVKNDPTTGVVAFFDFSFNSIVLIVLTMSFLNLIFNFKDKAFDRNRAMILLSNIIREIDEINVTIASHTSAQLEDKIAQFSFKYSTIIDSIPSHTDKNYFKAKKDYYENKRKSKEIDENYGENKS